MGQSSWVQLSLLAALLKTLANLDTFLPSPSLAHPFLAINKVWGSIKYPIPVLELAQLLATF